MKKVIKFSAVYCAPCRAMAPVFDEISQMDEFKNYEFKSIDVDSDDDNDMRLVEKFKIRSIPTIIIADDNENIISTTVGFSNKDNLMSFLKQHNE